MADNLKRTDGHDDSKINLNQPHEVQHWTKKWGISEKTLKEAVATVGVQVAEVEKWLRRNGHF
jgi:hypothetical protein